MEYMEQRVILTDRDQTLINAGGGSGRGAERCSRGGGGGGGRGAGRGRGGRGHGRGHGHGHGAPDINLLLEHPYLAFEDGLEEAQGCEKFRRMEIGGYRAVNWTSLEEVQEAARARDFISHDTPIFQMAYLPCYWLLVIEFLSSFLFTPRPADHPEEEEDPQHPWVEVRFRLGEVWFDMSLREFATHNGFYMLPETDTPLYTDGVHIVPRFDIRRF
ncbi:hypothetical protein HanPI659440_Chr04g0154511 [Helianthus annuus]|nr:hypothetical protein HanPI659440_Chr04g0154511 [Helianthus annuus]